MNAHKPIAFTPKQGGILATDISANEVGLQNYRVKRNWRRDRDRERRREGEDLFRPNLSIGQGNQALNAPADVTVIYSAVSANGRMAVLAGSKTTLYRYVALDSDFDYVAPGYFASDYVNDPTTEWIVIGSGFSPNGNRWEVTQIGDDVIFDNGVDLPVVYSLREQDVTPLYELREQGIVAVNTGAAFNDVQLFGDITQIKDGTNQLSGLTYTQEVLYPVPIPSFALQSGCITSRSTSSTATQQPNSTQVDRVSGTIAFDGSWVGKTLRFANGFRGTVVTVNSATQLHLDVSPPYENVFGPELYVPANFTPTGSIILGPGTYYFNGTATSSFLLIDGSGNTVVSPGNTYVVSVAAVATGTGRELSVKKITSTTGGGNIGLPFDILATDNSDITVTALTNVFDATMVGRRIFFSNGEIRTIMDYISPTSVLVDSDQRVSTGGIAFTIENPLMYSMVPESKTDRIIYRVIWSALSAARRYASSVPCSIAAGSYRLKLDYPARSFAAGQQVLVVGAGVTGGNLIATIVSVNGMNVLLDTAAGTAVDIDSSTGIGSGLVQAADTVGGIVGFEDLEQDGSSVLRMMDLNGSLVVYRDSGYQLAAYTGVTSSPFQFSSITETPGHLVYRYTLVKMPMNGIDVHLYAGETAWFTFDMVSKLPVEFKPLQNCARTFFIPASAGGDENNVFAADNEITKEIFICFPSPDPDTCLAYDYAYGTVSTIDSLYTAAATVIKPGASKKLFLLGKTNAGIGQVLTYGKAAQWQINWESDEIFTRLGQTYSSVIIPGLGSFGDSANQKTIDGYILEVSSFTENTNILVQLFSSESPNSKKEGKELLLGSMTFTDVESANLFPVFFLGTYFSDAIIVNGTGPCEITQRTYMAAGLRTLGVTKISG